MKSSSFCPDSMRAISFFNSSNSPALIFLVRISCRFTLLSTSRSSSSARLFLVSTVQRSFSRARCLSRMRS